MDDDAGNTERPAARWRVRLKGEGPDLEDLAELITSPSLRVVKGGAEFLLESRTFEHLGGSVEVLEEAQRLLPRLNGVGKLERNAFRDVDVDGCVYEYPPDGVERRQHAVVQLQTLDIRVRFPKATIVVDGQPAGPAPGRLDTDRWLELADRDPDVAEALETFDRPHDWVNLYRVFEIIRGRTDILRSGWASRNETDRFTRTANHPEAAGLDARHARSSAEPPPRPMTSEEGVELIRRIVAGWLDSLVSP